MFILYTFPSSPSRPNRRRTLPWLPNYMRIEGPLFPVVLPVRAGELVFSTSGNGIVDLAGPFSPSAAFAFDCQCDFPPFFRILLDVSPALPPLLLPDPPSQVFRNLLFLLLPTCPILHISTSGVNHMTFAFDRLSYPQFFFFFLF